MEERNRNSHHSTTLPVYLKNPPFFFRIRFPLEWLPGHPRRFTTRRSLNPQVSPRRRVATLCDVSVSGVSAPVGLCMFGVCGIAVRRFAVDLISSPPVNFVPCCVSGGSLLWCFCLCVWMCFRQSNMLMNNNSWFL